MNGRYTALSYVEKGLISRMKKIKNNNPDVDLSFTYFLPLGALEAEKRSWDGKAFSDFELETEEPEQQSSAPMAPNMAQKTEIAEVAPLPQTPAPKAAPVQTATANPVTGLTGTETALLSPDEQVIRQRQRGTA